jgi:hypothetical protein
MDISWTYEDVQRPLEESGEAGACVGAAHKNAFRNEIQGFFPCDWLLRVPGQAHVVIVADAGWPCSLHVGSILRFEVSLSLSGAASTCRFSSLFLSSFSVGCGMSPGCKRE